MGKRVMVIGVGGVGMAHVCAAVRQGWDVVSIVDVDREVLAASMLRWENRWEGVVEEVHPQPWTRYSVSIPSDIEADLAIVATPPETHEAIVGILASTPVAHVIVEKPLAISETCCARLGDRLSVSAEWIFHSALPRVISCNSLGMIFPASHRTRWAQPLPALLDFGPHLASLLWAARREVISNCTHYGGTVDRFTCCVDTEDGNAFQLWGNREGTPQGLYVDGVSCSWEDNLFDRQFEYGKGMPWPVAISADNAFRGCLS